MFNHYTPTLLDENALKEAITVARRRRQRPSNWQVYRGKAAPFRSFGVFLFFTIVAVLLFVLASTDQQIPINGFNYSPSMGYLFGAVLLLASFVYLLQQFGKRRSLVVITPDFVIKANNHRRFKKAEQVHFRDVTDIVSQDGKETNKAFKIAGAVMGNARVPSTPILSLDIYTADGRYRRWKLDNRFGKKSPVGHFILAAYKSFRHHHGKH